METFPANASANAAANPMTRLPEVAAGRLRRSAFGDAGTLPPERRGEAVPVDDEQGHIGFVEYHHRPDRRTRLITSLWHATTGVKA